MTDIWEREDFLVIYRGPGWYGDLGRWDSNSKSYTQGTMIAEFSEYDQSGSYVGPDEDQPQSIWDVHDGRGTPYKLTEEPVPETA